MEATKAEVDKVVDSIKKALQHTEVDEIVNSIGKAIKKAEVDKVVDDAKKDEIA